MYLGCYMQLFFGILWKVLVLFEQVLDHAVEDIALPWFVRFLGKKKNRMRTTNFNSAWCASSTNLNLNTSAMTSSFVRMKTMSWKVLSEQSHLPTRAKA